MADAIFPQSIVCVVAIQSLKTAGTITYRDFNTTEAKKWFPISLLLIGMIYTSTKALQFLSIPVYTIFKNLTTILIAYGEVLWFGGSVTSMALLSFGLMVLSSVIAAWADIQHALNSYGGDAHSGEAAAAISTLNAGYVWMMLNCFCSATYLLCMRKRIKLTNFKDFDSELLSSLQTALATDEMHSDVLQQSPDHPHPPPLLPLPRELVFRQPLQQLPTRDPQLDHHRHGHLRLVFHLHFVLLRLVRPRHDFYHLQHGRCPEQAARRTFWPHLLRCTGHDPECERDCCGFH